MSEYEIYVFILCLVVFILLTTLSTIMLVAIVHLMIKLIRSGTEDEKIKEEYEKSKNMKKNGIVDYIISIIFCAILISFFIFSLYVNISKNKYFEDIPTIKVVNTASMSKKHKDNKYLFKNNLNNQFDAFDLILTYKIPKEEDLKLYDIVVYEVDEILIVHRIVGIEEPNEKHPNERYFLLQGDAVESPDRFPVRYEQMKAIYRGEKIPFIGSFVSFMQSPAGWMCIILIIIAYIATPIIDKIITNEKQKRLALMIPLQENTEENVEEDFEEDIEEEFVCENIEANIDNNQYNNIDNFLLYVKENNIEERINLIEEILIKIHQFFENELLNIKSNHIDENQNKNSVENTTDNDTVENTTDNDTIVYNDNITIDNNNIDTIVNNENIVSNDNNKETNNNDNCFVEDDNSNVDNEIIDDIVNDNENTTNTIIVKKKRKNLTFRQRLHLSNDKVKQNYNQIVSTLKFAKIKVKESKKHETYKIGKQSIALINIKGKTLNVYLALNPTDYEQTKYKFINSSEIKKFNLYPMRLKITSKRQAKWTCELILKLFNEKNIKYVIKEITNQILNLDTNENTLSYNKNGDNIGGINEN